jgi:hypothetical protein
VTSLPETSRRPVPLLLLQTMRPRQWIKNSFVLAGVVFSGQLDDATSLGNAVVVTIAFCLASGASYLLNDARDAETDRLNPRTAGRPIARGDLPVGTAYAGAAVALVAALGLALAVNLNSAGVVAAFLALQFAYTLGLKHVLFIDVMAIAALFVLRAFAGVEAVDTRISPWLLLVTGLLALFLALTKRRGEAVAMGGQSNPQRPVLDYYSVSLLDELIGVVTPAVVVVYSIYTVLGASTDTMLATVPFVLYGVFRVLFLMHHRDRVGMTEEVDALVYRDIPLLACVVLWGVACVVIILTA